MRTFIFYDDTYDWLDKVEAENIESAIKLVTDDKAWEWKVGDSLMFAEQQFVGKVAVTLEAIGTPVTSREIASVFNEQPIGTILKAKIDSPMGIMDMAEGDIAVVTSSMRCLDIKNYHEYPYGTSLSPQDFASVWEIVHVPKS